MKSLKVLISIFLAMIILSCGSNTGSKNTSLNSSNQDNSNEGAVVKDSIENPNVNDAEINYSVYDNYRFGFRVYYPDFLVPQGESDNSDGQKFLSKDGNSYMLAYAKNNLSKDFNTDYEEATKGGFYYEKECIITYKTSGENFYVVSGKKGNKIFYARSEITESVIASVYFEFPQTDKKKFDAIISQVTASLVFTRKPGV